MANESRRILRLFLASAGDVNPERKIVREIVDSWNRSIGARRGWQVDVIGWDTHGSPDYGSDAQSLLNRQIADLRQYTFFVGIFKHRFGTPTPRADSGTNEEFNRAVSAYKRTGRLRIALYFSAAPFQPRSDEDMKQKQKVMDFRKKVRPLSLDWGYRTQQEFRKVFGEHFNGWMEEQMKAAAKAAPKSRATAKPEAAPKRKTPAKTKPAPVPKKPAIVATANPKSPLKAKPKTKTPAKATTRPRTPATVSTSGPWLLLDGHLFRKRRVKGSGNQLTLEIVPCNGEEESILRRLCDSQHYQNYTFAHGHDGGQVRINSHTHESSGNTTVWTLQVTLHRTSHGWLSPDDAKRRAELLLVGASNNGSTPALRDHAVSWVSTPMASRASNQTIGLFAALWGKMSGNRSQFLYAAFLHAVQRLKSDGLCEDILELKLGPVKNKKLRVYFRGRVTSSGFAGSEQVIEVRDDCPL